jgi:hypothetical protein
MIKAMMLQIPDQNRQIAGQKMEFKKQKNNSDSCLLKQNLVYQKIINRKKIILHYQKGDKRIILTSFSEIKIMNR